MREILGEILRNSAQEQSTGIILKVRECEIIRKFLPNLKFLRTFHIYVMESSKKERPVAKRLRNRNILVEDGPVVAKKRRTGNLNSQNFTGGMFTMQLHLIMGLV